MKGADRAKALQEDSNPPQDCPEAGPLNDPATLGQGTRMAVGEKALLALS
jgi:hypothetical protein